MAPSTSRLQKHMESRNAALQPPALHFDERNPFWVIRAQPVLAVGCGGDVAWRALLGFERLQSFFGALALDDLPACVVERDRILGDEQSIVAFQLCSGL